MFRTETTPELTKASIKHSGHKMPATPLAPPDFSASGSIEVNIFGMRQMNNEINTVKAQTNFRSVGTLRRMKYLNKHEKYCILVLYGFKDRFHNSTRSEGLILKLSISAVCICVLFHTPYILSYDMENSFFAQRTSRCRDTDNKA